MIDLRSDTVTKPTEEMRRAAYQAEVGDDVYGEDPSVRKLEETAAELLGKEATLYVTSGTQGNQIAVLTHCQRGNEIILESDSHIFYYETGAVAAFAGVQTRTINGNRGAMKPIDVQNAIRPADQHFPETGLICLENTHNRAGGAVLALSYMEEIYQIGQSHHIPIHLDGARLFHAAIAAQSPLSAFANYTDTLQVCLSKGLGAPVGSILAGDNEFIAKARKWRKRLGGGLRQVGMIAAPALIALTTMRDRLAEDHEHAQLLANELRQINGLAVVNQVDTNIVIIDVQALNITSEDFVKKLKEEGVLAVTFGPTAVRFVTHYDVSTEQINEAILAIAKVSKTFN
ncbi:low-specificity L-threonine aldolase [Cytobacillus spongiae]|uniref:low-specificity L-threonine aldolase n=1 Tax=Cytobacillus spongiae TaxID=2901381 RepID=UPI001F392309|nr:low-specificity L-threonine aldolase [Cytobacillus spongiae]UII54248.1 low-specificity L-threonine aldolase [Cytobacillus spongiae]